MSRKNVILSVIPAGIAALCMSWSSAASAQMAEDCKVTLAAPTIIIFDGSGVGYDPFDTRTYREEFRLEVSKDEGPACTVSLSLQSEQSGTERVLSSLNGADDLSYSIFSTVGRQIEIANDPDPQLNTPLTIELGEGSASGAFEFSFVIEPGQLGRADDYEDSLIIGLFEGGQTDATTMDRRVVKIKTTIASAAGISVSASDADVPLGNIFAVMDFGDLESGEKKFSFINIFSTNDYDLSFRSDNSGSLVHKQFADAFIPYIASIDGVIIDLAPADGAVLTGAGPTQIRGDSRRLEVEIGDFGQLRAGRYEDNIRIVVQPNL